jgi:hypothetical protein
MNTVVTDVEARLKALEAKSVVEENKIVAWFKSNWAHIPTWAGVAYAIFKHL